MKTKVIEAKARWDTESNPDHGGWVVDIKLEDGSVNTLPVPPSIYYASKTFSEKRVVRETLEWNGMVKAQSFTVTFTARKYPGFSAEVHELFAENKKEAKELACQTGLESFWYQPSEHDPSWPSDFWDHATPKAKLSES